ncbi:hypothetical protein NHX12_023018 [Muraenolepis orangiensis]|uniref:nucleoside diphosphate phosphatase n=1 Tax=Muraenolepis orangiensis TaxID=630683 RepID=A0A9Q0ERA0_9TELE|nr:hypothetical protein NHX12_023018 [Muraenolepis orangiensis]
MRIPKLASVFVVVVCMLAYLIYTKRHYSMYALALYRGPAISQTDTTAGGSFRYGVMFDAGSTGTRIHVFKFLHKPHEVPKLARETFKAITPGLSAYADDPEQCTAGLMELFEVAKGSVPSSLWNNTPLVLKATAGLRLLPGEKATQLLNKVRAVFSESPFLSRHDAVSIMDGTDEGISAWITVNFLTGSLGGAYSSTVGMLDLGGGSTQITFSPQDEKTIQTSPIDYISSIQMFNTSYTLYSHSYLGLGLLSARLAVLGGVEGQDAPGNVELVSPCLAPEHSSQWKHGDVIYTVKGQKEGEPAYESCLTKVEKVLYKKVQKAPETSDVDFYAFSFYYDLAADLGLIDGQKGGTVKVSDYSDAAKRVKSPFMCLDLTYISVLLQELGFHPDKVLKLARTIDHVETSWALGAIFHYMESNRSLEIVRKLNSTVAMLVLIRPSSTPQCCDDHFLFSKHLTGSGGIRGRLRTASTPPPAESPDVGYRTSPSCRASPPIHRLPVPTTPSLHPAALPVPLHRAPRRLSGSSSERHLHLRIVWISPSQTGKMGNEASYPLEMCSHWKRFKKLDLDNSGSLSVEEFMSLPELQQNPLVQRVIDIFDTDGNGEVDFKEFIEGVSQFSVKGDKEQKLRFAFRIYDMDKDGYISNGELFQVLKMMVGNNLKDTQLQQIVDKTIINADKDGDGRISFEEFCAVSRPPSRCPPRRHP